MVSTGKGLALTIESVVLLVLAGVVLVSLLAFFTGTFNPAKDETKKTFDITIACGNYVKYDPTCRGGNVLSKKLENQKELLDNLVNDIKAACEKGGISDVFSNDVADKDKLNLCCKEFCAG